MINKKGFTLIELMVVISIIAILATVVMVTMQSARERAEDTARMAAVSQIRSLAYAAAGSSDDVDLNDLSTLGGEIGQIICKYGSLSEPTCESLGILSIEIDVDEREYCMSIELLEKDSTGSSKYFCVDKTLTAKKYDNLEHNCKGGNPSCL